ncbi:hypothetical protein [Vibrio maritimus]|uniref:hypothetical protein n=1 Tax=Vibrio maritimus TaxID=990268 RepID=UPI001F18ABA8|nr:hypothetical protein [Vibrio maritimus]
MRVSKVAAAVAISTGLLMGCNGPEVIDENPGGGTGGGTTPTSELAGSYWQISEQGSAAAQSSADLPNVYVFDGTTQRYYDDDATPGTYTIYTTSFTEDIDAKTITFTYYGESGEVETTGDYSVSGGALTIDTDNSGMLSGADQSENSAVTDAVTEANDNAGFNNSVQILDTLTTDVGELRLKLSDSSTGATVDSIASGRLTVDVIYQEDEDTVQDADGTGDNAYISLYTNGTSNKNLYGEVILSEGKVQYRGAGVGGVSGGSITDAGGTFTNGEKLAIEVTWGNSEFKFKVNDEEFTGEITEDAAVTVISLKIGDTSNTTNFEFIGDNLAVYSSDSGTETLVFEDDFDNYAVGQNLSGNPYNSSTSEATVIGDGDTTDPTEPTDVTDDFESYTVGDLISDASGAWTTANIKDDADGTTTAEVAVDPANSEEKSLYLEDKNSATKPFAMRAFTAPATAGSVSLDAYFPSTNTKSTYINIGDGKNNSDRYFELNQSGTKLKYEAGSDDVEIASGIALDTWHSFTISWTDAGLVTVTMNGQTIATDIDQATTGLDSSIVPSQLTLYTGDNSSTVNTAYFDNVDSELF